MMKQEFYQHFLCLKIQLEQVIYLPILKKPLTIYNKYLSKPQSFNTLIQNVVSGLKLMCLVML